MADIIASLCVLCEMDRRGGAVEYFLYLREQKADGSHEDSHIPMWEQGTPKPGCHYPMWSFKRDGGRLQCHPSVHNLVSGFHNSAHWSVEFVEVNGEWFERAEKPSLDVSRLHYELNMTPEKNGVGTNWQSGLIAAKVAEGILLPRA